MRHFRKITLLLSILFIYSEGFSQKFTNRGTDFWVGYGHHQYMEPGYDNSQQMVLYFYTGSTPATVTVKIEGSGNPIPPPVGGPWTRVYSIPANTVISIEDPMPPGASVVSKNPNCIPAIGPIPKGLASDCGFDARLYTLPPPTGTGGEGPFKKRAIHVTSTTPIVAYAHIYASVSSGATMLMPVETWGYNYTCINSDQNNTNDAYSWMYVIAQHDSTWIRITPSVPSRNGRPAGVPFDTVLNRGEIYQLVAKLYAPPNDDAGFNLTGTTIRSIDTYTGKCWPIAVFAGSSRTGGEPPCQTGGRDNDMQQIPPEQSWGKRYLTAPFSNSSSASSTMNCVYKVQLKTPGTVVRRNGIPLTGLQPGNFYKFASTTADYIDADNPILVAQFMGGGCVSGNGDPEMVYLSPIEQAIDSVGFYRNTQQSIDQQFLTLIVPTNGVSSLKIDGTLFNALPAGANKASYPHPNLPGYTVCTRRWSPATKGASTAYCDSAFNGITYGEGGAESYAYNAGTYINNINSVPGIKNVLDTNNQTSQYTCINTPVRLGISLFYKPTQITWEVAGVPNMTPTVNDTTVGNGSVIIPPDDSTFNGTKWLYTYFYKASNGKDTFYFSTAGRKYVDVLIRNPNPETCFPFEKVTLEFDVKAKPVLATPPFTYTIGSCGVVNFNTPAVINGDTVQQFIWTFGGTDVTGVQNPVRNFSGGNNGDSTVAIKFAIGNSVGCYVDTNMTILITSDTINFNVTPTALCQTAAGSTVNITPGVAPVTASEWYWDYGDGTKDTLFNANPFTHTYTTYGTFIITHSIKNTGGCNPVAPSKTVTVHAQPFATFNISPSGCLPASGQVQFTSTATAPDGQAVTIHAWDFGDPNATPGNPNTSAAPNPTHNYSVVGPYTITYSATTANGCKKDTIVNTVFNKTPAVTFAPINDVCANAAPFNITQGSVTNGVPVTELYAGPGITNGATGQFDPAIAGPGTHTIWYYATSTTGNCVDSASQTINVKSLLVADFLFPTTCLNNYTVQFTNNSTTGVTYSWDFGDGSPLDNTFSPSHTYAGSGPYNVILNVSSATGCPNNKTQSVTVRVQPALAVAPLPAVCGTVTPFNITNITITNGVVGTGTFSGPGITNAVAGTFDPTVSGPGAHVVKYVYTSTLGCSDSINQTINVNPAPFASFTFPTNCLPNSTVQFTNNSTGGNTYAWDFGDGSPIDNSLSPMHMFAGSGPYNVKLTVTGNGCSKDTIIPVTVRVKPILTFKTLSSVCANVPPYSLDSASVTNGVTGTGVYSGPGITNGTTGAFDPSIAGVGTHSIKYVFISTLGCSDSLTRSIVVKAIPFASFTFPVNCLANSNVQFTNVSTGATGYSWDFGDGSPNSSATSPAHTFAGSGPYNVKLTALANGCNKDTIIPVIVRVQPTLAFKNLSSVCANVLPYSLDSASVTNGVTGTGVYSGPGITNGATGAFNPALAGVGNHLIKYVFTSTLGCSDSISKSITVKAIPFASFSFPTNCLNNSSVPFTNNSTGALSYIWDFGDGSPTVTTPSPVHTYAGSGPFNVKLTAISNGCSKDTIIPVTVRVKPTLAFSAINAVCANTTPFAITGGSVTNGVTGTGIYTGPGITNGATGTFNASLASLGNNTIKYIFTSTLGCIDSIAQTVLVKGVPKAGFSFPTNCLPNGTVNFTDTSKLPSGTPTYLWSFDEPSSGAANTSAVKNAIHTFATPGPFNVKMVVTVNGCSDSATTPVTVRVKPQLNFTAPSSVCANVAPYSIATGTVTNGVTGTAKYKGKGVTDTLLGIFNPSIAGVGTHNITYYFVSSLGCTDSVTRQIVVKVVPVAAFTYPTNCLPNNMVQFTNTSTPALVGSYVWNFGDPGSGSANTSLQTSPSHSYNVFGTYPVKLTITVNGCSDDTTVNATFRLQPIINFPTLPSVCQSNVTISIATATIANGVPPAYPGRYNGPGVVDTLGLFNPEIAGSGSKNIVYTFTGEGGCVATKTSTIFVNPRPVVNRIFFPNRPDSNICFNDTLQISNQSLISVGSITKWNWNLGDNTDTTFTSNTIIKYLYAVDSTYKITLETESDKGCKSIPVSKFITVRAIPVASFNAPAGVCMPNGLVKFENTSTVRNENASTLNYIWFFGDGSSPSSVISPTHTYNLSLPQTNVILRAVSAYGCKDEDTAVLMFYIKPQSQFAVTPNIVCQGKPVVFTNLTTSPGILSSVWNFGDGSNTSTAASPVKTYFGFGEYSASLTVTDVNGCKDSTRLPIKVYFQPKVEAGKSFVVNAGTLIQFQGSVNAPSLTLNWSPAIGLNSSSILNPTLKALANRTYTLTATGQGGCIAFDTLTVSILQPLKIPNAFSPNGDGVNERWEIANLRDYPGCSVEVFNRYGKSVFLSNGRYTKSWDGTFNGNKLPNGTYYYVIDLFNGEKPISGHVTILK